jgi:hypothetical protein
MIHDDQVTILFPSPNRIQALYRLYLTSTARLPQYLGFMKDAETLAHGLILEGSDDDEAFQRNLRQFVDSWVTRPAFVSSFRGLDDTQYVDRLLANAGIELEPPERAALINELGSGKATRAGVLLKIAGDRRLIEKENYRSLVLLHYFAYLHRNPGEPPDKDLSGFNFWIEDLAKEGNPGKLSVAFRNSTEYRRSKENK